MNLRKCLLFALTFAAFLALPGAQLPNEPEPDPKLPSGKSQREAILKQEHEKSLNDATELQKLTEELKADLEKADRHVVSVATIRKLENIEKLAKRIRSRLNRF